MSRALALVFLFAACGDASVAPGDLASSGGDGALPDLAGDAAVAPDLLPAGVPFVYVSGYSTTIARYRLDLPSGALTPAGTTTVTGSPSFLAVDPAQRHLYAVNEQTAGQVEAFAIDPASGALTHLNDASSGGNGPAHLSVDRSGAWVLAANYGDGTIAVLALAADGSLGAASDTRAAGMNAHEILTDPTNAFVFVPCLGANYIAQYTFAVATGKLAPNAVPHVSAAAGAGPRHLAFHPTGPWVYTIQETDSTVTAYTLDAASGQLASMQTISTLPAGFSGSNTGAEVAVHPSGKFLYASNRGDDSLAIFTLDGAGRLTAAGNHKSGGATPRHFSIDPSGRWLLVANQGGNNVVVLAIDQTSGALTPTGTPIAATAPSFVGVVTLPGH